MIERLSFIGKNLRRGLFQVTLAGTALAAFRFIQSPSTLNAFVAESAIGITAGVFLHGRLVAGANPLRVPDAGLSSAAGEATQSRRGADRANLALTSAFFVLVGLAVLVLSSAIYVAPVAFYGIAAVAAGALALNAQLNGETKPNWVLGQIMVFAILMKIHFFYLNAYLYSSDAFYHFQIVRAIEATGHIPGNAGHYSYFPDFHAFGFAGSLVTAAPLTWYGTFTFVSQLATVPLAYLIGRDVGGHRAGLFAALLLSLSVFFFLSAGYVPSLFGSVFLFSAIYAVLQLRRTRRMHWLGVFWISAAATLFSHAISALVLFIALLVALVSFSVPNRTARRSHEPSIPAISYGVLVAVYLAFVALSTFEQFVEVVFSPPDTDAPALATNPTRYLQTTDLYIFQSVLAPSGFVLLFFLATFGGLWFSRLRQQERRFLTLLGIAFILIPAVEIVAGSFRTQSSRFLLYMTIPLVLLGGLGVVRAGPIRPSRTFPVVAFGFVSASSYLTNSDSRELYSDIPAQTTHITDSTLASREFLTRTDGRIPLYMDRGSLNYIGNTNRARDALRNLDTYTLDELNSTTTNCMILLNWRLIHYGSPYTGSFYDIGAIETVIAQSGASRLYDSGSVQIYMIP